MNKLIFSISLLLFSNIACSINFSVIENNITVGIFDSITRNWVMIGDMQNRGFILSSVPPVIDNILTESGNLEALANNHFTPHTFTINHSSIETDFSDYIYFCGCIITLLNADIASGSIHMNFSIFIQHEDYTIQLVGTYISEPSGLTIPISTHRYPADTTQ